MSLFVICVKKKRQLGRRRMTGCGLRSVDDGVLFNFRDFKRNGDSLFYEQPPRGITTLFTGSLWKNNFIRGIILMFHYSAKFWWYSKEESERWKRSMKGKKKKRPPWFIFTVWAFCSPFEPPPPFCWMENFCHTLWAKDSGGWCAKV